MYRDDTPKVDAAIQAASFFCSFLNTFFCSFLTRFLLARTLSGIIYRNKPSVLRIINSACDNYESTPTRCRWLHSKHRRCPSQSRAASFYILRLGSTNRGKRNIARVHLPDILPDDVLFAFIIRHLTGKSKKNPDGRVH